MNFLAHSYLSYTLEERLGNLIADFVKNRDRERYSLGIRHGIQLHREIDNFTDMHPKVLEAKRIFSPLVGLYAGAFIDISFDYFLANLFSEKDLLHFTEDTYRSVGDYMAMLPQKTQFFLSSMQRDNWLYNYRTDFGIKMSFQHLLKKAKYLENHLSVFDVFLENKPKLQIFFADFFPELENKAQTVHAAFGL
ncbi:MAG: DUF479 domain-containing protein [Bergeyella sp.]|nr:DUF479 domain-containing protein [Bergeyella sp.]